MTAQLATATRIRDRPTAAVPGAPACIAFDNVAMAFPSKAGQVNALEGVSCSIAEREFVSVVGPSGCGKSTLLRLTARLLHPSEGQVRVMGQDVDALRRERRFGFVFQSSVMLPWRTALQNVKLPVEVIGRQHPPFARTAAELLDLVGLSNFHHLYPRQLSGGMRQRVAIARALSFDPPILLMDEPFGALDALTRQKLHSLLLGLWENSPRTVMFITHYVYEAVLLSDRVLVMTGTPGRIWEEVTVDLPRPRHEGVRAEPRFGQLVNHILSRLMAA